MAVREIATSDRSSRVGGSYSREVTRLGKLLHGVWRGYALLKAGVSYASLDIIIPAQQRGLVDTTGMVIDANSRIVSVSMCPRKALTLGASTGKLKLATALAAATATLYVETAAASSNALAVANPVETINGDAAVTVGGSDVTYKIYATDGAAGGSAAASTVSAASDTYIDVEIGFWKPAPFPSRLEVGTAAPAVL